MNGLQRVVGLVGLVLCMAAGLSAQVGFSTEVEPALNAPARFGVSAAVTVNLTEDNAFSVRAGSGRTLLPGFTRTLVEFYPGADLFADLQGGVTQYKGRMRGMFTYGGGVATDLGRGVSVSYGLHIDKVMGRPLYPSAYVSLGYSFGGRRLFSLLPRNWRESRDQDVTLAKAFSKAWADLKKPIAGLLSFVTKDQAAIQTVVKDVSTGVEAVDPGLTGAVTTADTFEEAVMGRLLALASDAKTAPSLAALMPEEMPVITSLLTTLGNHPTVASVTAAIAVKPPAAATA